MPHDPVIFLDVDGVLHPAAAPGSDALSDTLRPQQMEFLKEICHSVDGGVKIILTSNWRKYHALKNILQTELVKFGIGGIHDSTEVLNNDRRTEICQWLKNYEPTRFIIVDDLNLSDETEIRKGHMWQDTGVYQHFVQTDFEVGLTRQTTDYCIEKLRTLSWEGLSYDDDIEDTH